MYTARSARVLGALLLTMLAVGSTGCPRRRNPPPGQNPVATPTGAAITWTTNATQYRAMVGQPVTVICPPGGSPSTVWGTDIYTDDSSICGAAVHAGRIMQAVGGAVTFFPAPGLPAYQGSPRNGVNSSNYGSWQGSFSFTPGMPMPQVPPMPTPMPTPMPMPGMATPIQWSDNATRFRGQLGAAIRLQCPPGGAPGSVWGSVNYTDDSSICTAAMHAGLVNPMTGGVFTLRPLPGLPSYMGTTANGVTSQNYGSWQGSFSVSPM